MNLSPLAPYLSLVEIILAITLTVLVLIQAKGSDLGGFFGGSGDSGAGFRTRRGVEATMHRVTIFVAIAFFLVTLFTFIALGQTS